MIRKESLVLINSFIYAFIVALGSLDLIFILPIIFILYFERKYLFKIFKKLILLNFFIIFLVAFLFFQDQKEAIELFVRTNLILLFNISSFHKSKGYDIVRGLDALRFNSKIVSSFYFSLSIVEYLLKDFNEIKNTLKLRGFRSNTSLFTYETYGNVFGIIFLKVLKKSEEMNQSMTVRGFENKIFLLNSNTILLNQKIITISIVVVCIKVLYELYS